VVGGGVIGLASAWRASQAGMSVTVLERDIAGRGTSHVAAHHHDVGPLVL
jgi:glycine/D-amino acid oxidase-like deaminating enzyme